MTNYNPTYKKGALISNEHTDERFKIKDMEYDKTLCDIVYTVQHYRFKFDMRKIPESLIKRNIRKGHYVINNA